MQHLRIVWWLAALGMLAGCASPQGRPLVSVPVGETPTIGFVVKNPSGVWFQQELRFARQCARDCDFRLIEVGAPTHAEALEAIDRLAAAGAQGLIICAPDTTGGREILERAANLGLRVYTVDDRLVTPAGSPLKVPFMGIDGHQIGRAVGRTLWEEMQRRGWPIEETWAMALTNDGVPSVKVRTDAAAQALVEAGFPPGRILRSPLPMYDIPGGRAAAEALLTRHGDVRRWLVFSVNDEGVLGALQALKGRELGPDSAIGVGIGGPAARVEFEKTKETGFYATCLISPRRHGYESAQLMYRWITEGIAPPKVILTRGIIVTRDDFEQQMREQGLID
jgi:L-arabinose transport system substrate-binding protein